jgi:hypothetical protein
MKVKIRIYQEYMKKIYRSGRYCERFGAVLKRSTGSFRGLKYVCHQFLIRLTPFSANMGIHL